MRSLNLKLGYTVVFVLIALSTASIASASNKDFDFSVQPQVSFVESGQNVTVSYTVTNNTSSSSTCSFHIEELNFDAPLGTIAGSTSAGGTLSTPALYKNAKLTFTLVCDGNTVGSRSVNIKVR